MKFITYSLIIVSILLSNEYLYSQEGDMSKMTTLQRNEYWKKKKEEEKAHKKAVKKHWKRVGNETEIGSNQKVYKRMKNTKRESKRLNNKKHRNPFLKKNKRLDRDPLYKRILYKLRKKQKS